VFKGNELEIIWKHAFVSRLERLSAEIRKPPAEWMVIVPTFKEKFPDKKKKRYVLDIKILCHGSEYNKMATGCSTSREHLASQSRCGSTKIKWLYK
jgi:hypothetical protein